MRWSCRHAPTEMARFDSLFADLQADNPQRSAWQAVRAFRWGSRADQEHALQALNAADEKAVGIAAGRVAAHTHNFAGARRIAELLVGRRATNEWRAAKAVLSAQLDLASNDWPAARQTLRSAEEWERDWTRQLYALYLLHPFANARQHELRAERDRLGTWTIDYSPSASFFFGPHAMVRPELRLYLLGLLSAALRETDRATAFKDSLFRAPRNDVREEDVARFARSLSESLRGHIALAQGQDTMALRILTGVEAEVEARPEFLALSPFYARAHDRFVIASLNEKLRRDQEAIRWYRSLLEGYDFVYAAAAHQNLVAIYQRAGDSTAVRHHRAEFARLAPPRSAAVTRP